MAGGLSGAPTKGYGKTDEGNLLAPSRSSLNLLDDMAVREWMKQKRQT